LEHKGQLKRTESSAEPRSLT